MMRHHPIHLGEYATRKLDSVPAMFTVERQFLASGPAKCQTLRSSARARAAQTNIIEFHTWNWTAKNIGKPDRMVIDLDPGEGASWQHLGGAAVLVLTVLFRLSLDACIKTEQGLACRDASRSVLRLQHGKRALAGGGQDDHEPLRCQERGAERVGKIFYPERTRRNNGRRILAPRAPASVLSFQTADPRPNYWASKQPPANAMEARGYAPREAGSVPRPRRPVDAGPSLHDQARRRIRYRNGPLLYA